jgi:hypothetical protein
MNTTRFLVTGALAITFGSLPFAAMTPAALRDAHTQSVSHAQSGQAQLALAQEPRCAALNSTVCP